MANTTTTFKFGNINLLIFFMIILFHFGISSARAELSAETKKCISCHDITSAAVFSQWSSSRHAEKDIGCYECHKSDQDSPDLFMHEGFAISIIVSPSDCARCHEAYVKDYSASLHAKAANILKEHPAADHLGNVVMGEIVVAESCTTCHGSTVKVLQGGKLDPDTWPNTGVGRVNPDGSLGSCSACHQRHKFSIAQARRPKTCGRCHMGRDKPQIHVYEASKHGISFEANEGLMNLDSVKWVVGEDYFTGPTCATCHLSAAPGLAVTHNQTKRLSWILRHEISEKRDNWQTKRNQMGKVCTECHSSDFITSWYKNFDTINEFYNSKFGNPAHSIMSKLLETGKLTSEGFDDKIEWIYFNMWDYESRAARNGAAMQSNEYIKDGFLGLAKSFYSEFLPEAKALNPDVVKEVLSAPEHQWYSAGDLINGVTPLTTPDLNLDGKVDSKDLLYFNNYWHR